MSEQSLYGDGLYDSSRNIELWGGVECTVNRVQNRFLDQLERNGHLQRLSDFDRFRELGITTLRHGILWERTAPEGLERANWNWADRSLERLRELGIRPIVGLVHHGSGPRTTSLLDPQFPEKLAAYASVVASRYPWLVDYTPVNEPLTTARFSALYGHWYPHAQDDLSFCRALLNQCRAVILSIRAIREINSSARLIQTEDLGKIFSTPKLAYQAEFENARRWSTFDLLRGSVNREHPLWSYFRWAGIEESQLAWFLDNSCPPDVVGVNHYLSGERYLDEHLDRYPPYTHGGNGRDRYADVLAARVLRDGVAGPEALLQETWQRYHLPVAITECHNGCTREEQLRWFVEVWNAADRARASGANVVGVTAWSLLGAYDWNHLVTRDAGHYEPGIFDIRSPSPRPTALAGLLQQLSSRGAIDHPVLDQQGWWRRPKRFVYGFSVDETGRSSPVSASPGRGPIPFVRPLVITGARGTLARAFARICGERGLSYCLLDRDRFDIADPVSVEHVLRELRPWAVINAAGYARVDDAEIDRDLCYRENAEGPSVLAAECEKRAIRLMTFSSDLVFDGQSEGPCVESDATNPVNYYGFSKLDGEKRVRSAMPSALVIRSSAFFGPWDEYNVVVASLRTLAAGLEFKAAEDVIVSPTYVPDLVHASLDLLMDGESGIWHLANSGEISWADLVEKTATSFGVPTETLSRCLAADMELPAKRPLFSALGSERAVLLPSFADALSRFVRESECDIALPAMAV